MYQKSSIRCFGVQLEFNMNDFVSTICKILFATMNARKHAKVNLSTYSQTHVPLSSRIDFCLPLLTVTSQCNINRRQSIINSAARIVSKKTKRDHISFTIREFRWLDVPTRMHKRKHITFNHFLKNWHHTSSGWSRLANLPKLECSKV